MKTTEEKILDVLEDIQEAIIKAGGNFIRQKELTEMTVEGFLKVAIPNNILITVEYIPKSKPMPTPKRVMANKEDEDDV